MHQAALLHHSFQNAKAYGWLLEELPKHDWYESLAIVSRSFFFSSIQVLDDEYSCVLDLKT